MSPPAPAPFGAHAALLVALALGACGDAPAAVGADERPHGGSAGPLAVEEPPSDPPDERLDLAAARIVAGQHAAAAELLDAVLADHPGHGRAELLRGVSLHERKLYARALPHFEHLLARGGSFEGQAAVHYYLGWCRYSLGDVPGARAAFRRHLEHAPDEADTHFGLGLLDLEDGELESALARFRSSIELLEEAAEHDGAPRAPAIAKAWARSADVHLLRGELEEARDALERCVALHPAHYAAYYKLHEARRRLGDDEGARRALQLHELWKRRAEESR